MMETKWITLPHQWKLQDVQAALNVIIAFLCAASVFVLVRLFWAASAKRFLKKKEDIPAYALLSLNTIGESIDVIWLLRHELFTSRYRGLLIQCVFVLLLTLSTLGSGFLARLSTRGVYTIVPQQVEGSLSSRDTSSILNDILDVSAVYDNLTNANFPDTKLAEWWPRPGVPWEFNDQQWNSSWSMNCTYQENQTYNNPSIVSDECVYTTDQLPWVRSTWQDWQDQSNSSNIAWDVYADFIGYGFGDVKFQDMLYFTHGLEFLDVEYFMKHNYSRSMVLKTAVWHMTDVPRAPSTSNCSFVTGPIGSARYNTAMCQLTRNTNGLSEEDLKFWGAAPDWFDINRQVNTFTEYYSGRLRRETFSANSQVTMPSGPELTRVYQAYQIVKDTAGSLYYDLRDPAKPLVNREIDVQVRAAQVSLTCLIVCGVMAAIVLIGVAQYWYFILTHMKELHQTPQSKLDWMMQTLRKDNETKIVPRQVFRNSISSTDLRSEAVPLTKMDDDDRYKRTSIVTTRSIEPEEMYAEPAVVHSDSAFSPRNIWSPVSPGGRFDGGIMRAHSTYSRISNGGTAYNDPHVYSNYDTAYDPARR